MLLLLAAALASPCPAGCSFLEGHGLRGGGPCGCGFGLVRRVKTRDELEKLSQPDLDAYKRDVDAELVELKGEKDASAEKHKEELKEMKATQADIITAMDEKTSSEKAGFNEKHAEYTKDAEKVTELEGKVRDLSDRGAAAQAELSVVNGDLEFNLMNAQSCECDAVEQVLLKHHKSHHKAKAANATAPRKSNSEVRAEKKSKASLLAKPDFQSIFAIEKTETEIVDYLKDIAEGQSEYDAEVRKIQHAREMAQLNHTKVTSAAGKDADLLNTRAEAQKKAVKALEDMVATKEASVEAAESRAKDAKEQLEGLTAELKKCGCA